METTCKLCGNDTFNILRRKLRYDIQRDVLACTQCGYVFLRPLTSAQKEYYQDAYRKQYGPDLKKKSTPQDIFNTYVPYQQPIIDEIRPLLRPDLRVLDVGCSTGHFLTALKPFVGERIGIELGKDDVAFIREKLDFKVYDEPIQHIKEEPFDLVTSLQVLEHIDDPLPFLKEIGRLLKPEGRLYLELPNLHDVLLDGYKVEGYADFYFREPHVSYFTEKTLKNLLDQAGFVGEIKTVQRYNVLNHLHWMMTGKPQDNFTLGNGAPELIRPGNLDPEATEGFNAFVLNMDAEYKRLIQKHGLGESLTFLGKKK